MSDRLAFATIAELGRMIRSGEVSPTQLATHSLERLDTVGRSLNAVVTLTQELAMRQAQQAEDELSQGVDRGPLHGITYGVKDLFSVPGYPTTWGAAPYREQQFDEEAAVIERLREAGAVLVAKLAMVELAGGFGYEQPDAAFNGPGKSAWSEEAWSGGSSSGSGSAVGSGCVPFAIGTETWGSIHYPSMSNGVTGFRPTFGRISRRGAMALSWSMDKIGPMCRTAEDCTTVHRLIAGPDSADTATLYQPKHSPMESRTSGFRIAVLAHSTDDAQPEVAANFRRSLQLLAQLGQVEEVDLPEYPFDAAAGLIIEAEGASAFEEFILSGGSLDLTAPEDKVGLHQALAIPAVDYLRALRIRKLGAVAMDKLLADFDAIVAPTYPFVTMPINDRFEFWLGGDKGPSLGGAGNLCGLPSIAIPNGFGERGLPTSLELMGGAWSDETVLAIAAILQQKSDWHTIHPPLADTAH